MDEARKAQIAQAAARQQTQAAQHAQAQAQAQHPEGPKHVDAGKARIPEAPGPKSGKPEDKKDHRLPD